jgi:hypothetical protein
VRRLIENFKLFSAVDPQAIVSYGFEGSVTTGRGFAKAVDSAEQRFS